MWELCDINPSLQLPFNSQQSRSTLCFLCLFRFNKNLPYVVLPKLEVVSHAFYRLAIKVFLQSFLKCAISGLEPAHAQLYFSRQSPKGYCQSSPRQTLYFWERPMLKTYTKPWSSLLVAKGAMSSTPVVRQMNKINENILGCEKDDG